MPNENENITPKDEGEVITPKQDNQAGSEAFSYELGEEETSEQHTARLTEYAKKRDSEATQLHARLKKVEHRPEPKTEEKKPPKKISKEDTFITKEKYEEDMFFSKNKELEPHRKLIKAMKGDKTYDEIVKSDEIKGYLTSKEDKSVIHNNSRIATNDTEYQKAFKEAEKSGDWSKVVEMKQKK